MPGDHAQCVPTRYLTPGACHPSGARSYKLESGGRPDIVSVLWVEWSHSLAPEIFGDSGEGVFLQPRGMRTI